MSVRRLSPTANLLRTSRLFALPRSLPRPLPDRINFDSPTATTEYPTHQAIETTEKSIARGDWGLKRPLPLRSTTQTSTPHVRIDNIDSIDFITDFASAADHTRTLDKWQELDLPVSTILRERRASSYQPPPQSVFEPELDNTATSDEDTRVRWKFQGPWLAGLSEGDFEEYVKKKVGRRKDHFREFLRNRFATSIEADRRRRAVESGGDLEDLASSTTPQVSEAALDIHIKRLREDEEEMQQAINEYLDLPRDKRFQTASLGRSSYNDKGPPVTHPSGGLSYLRTAAHLANHPLHGPQEDKIPVQARVLAPQTEMNRPRKRAILGLAGVVSEDDRQPFASGDDSAEVEYFNPDLEGGGKVWVDPKRASIDTEGRIELTTRRAEKNAIMVATKDKVGLKKSTKKYDIPPAAIRAAKDRSLPDFAASRQKGEFPSGRSYGLDELDNVPRQAPAEGLTQSSDRDPISLLEKVLAQANNRTER